MSLTIDHVQPLGDLLNIRDSRELLYAERSPIRRMTDVYRAADNGEGHGKDSYVSAIVAKQAAVAAYFGDAREMAEEDGLIPVSDQVADLALSFANRAIQGTYPSRQVTVGATVRQDGGANVVIRHQSKQRRIDLIFSADGRTFRTFTTDAQLTVEERASTASDPKALDHWLDWLAA